MCVMESLFIRVKGLLHHGVGWYLPEWIGVKSCTGGPNTHMKGERLLSRKGVSHYWRIAPEANRSRAVLNISVIRKVLI